MLVSIDLKKINKLGTTGFESGIRHCIVKASKNNVEKGTGVARNPCITKGTCGKV